MPSTCVSFVAFLGGVGTGLCTRAQLSDVLNTYTTDLHNCDLIVGASGPCAPLVNKLTLPPSVSELLGCYSSRRPSVHTFKHEYLRPDGRSK